MREKRLDTSFRDSVCPAAFGTEQWLAMTDLKIERDGKDLLVKTSWTKDTLKAMPDYKDDRPAPARTKSGG